MKNEQILFNIKSEEALFKRIVELINQLACTLDKTVKFSELNERQRYLQRICNLKRELLTIKSKLQKDHNLTSGVKSFTRLYLEVNGLNKQISLKQSSNLWNKQNRRRVSKQIKYEEAMQELLRRESIIKTHENELVYLRNQLSQLKQHQINLTKQLETQKQEGWLKQQQIYVITQSLKQMKRIVEQYQVIIKQQDKKIMNMNENEKQNILICEKGANQIQRLSKMLQEQQILKIKLQKIIRIKEVEIKQLNENFYQKQKERVLNVNQLTQMKQELITKNQEIRLLIQKIQNFQMKKQSLIQKQRYAQQKYEKAAQQLYRLQIEVNEKNKQLQSYRVKHNIEYENEKILYSDNCDLKQQLKKITSNYISLENQRKRLQNQRQLLLRQNKINNSQINKLKEELSSQIIYIQQNQYRYSTQINNLRNIINEKDNLLNSKQNKIRSDIQILRQQKLRVNGEIRTIREQYSKLKKKNEEYHQQVNKQKQMSVKHKKKVDEITSQLNRQKQGSKKLKQQLNQLKQENKKVKDQFTVECQNKIKQISNIKNRNIKLQTKVQQLQIKINFLNTQIQNSKQNQERVQLCNNQQIKNYQDQINLLNKKIQQQNQNYFQINQQLNNTNIHLNTLKKKLQNTEQQLKKNNEEYRNLDSNINQTKKNLEEKTKKIKELVQENKNLKKENQNYFKKFQQKQKNLIQIQKTYQKMKVKYQEVERQTQQRLKQKNQNQKSLKIYLQNITEEYHQYKNTNQKKIATLNETINNLNSKISERNESLNQSKSLRYQIQLYEKELENSKNKINDLNKINANLLSEHKINVSLLKKQIQDLKNQIKFKNVNLYKQNKLKVIQDIRHMVSNIS